jgi:hypothetical protein
MVGGYPGGESAAAHHQCQTQHHEQHSRPPWEPARGAWRMGDLGAVGAAPVVTDTCEGEAYVSAHMSM